MRFDVVDDILAAHAGVLGADATGYRNHVHRGLHYFAALAGGEPPVSVLVAAAFHDLGIWTERTFDYLAPSTRAALAYLSSQGLEPLIPEVTALIAEHHRLRPYRGPYARTVELFRRADLVDLSLGAVRSGLPAALVRSVKASLPDAGFHARLVSLAASQLLRHPSNGKGRSTTRCSRRSATSVPPCTIAKQSCPAPRIEPRRSAASRAQRVVQSTACRIAVASAWPGGQWSRIMQMSEPSRAWFSSTLRGVMRCAEPSKCVR